MIVLDASAALELLLGTPKGRTIADLIRNPETSLHAPHLLDIEVAQVLRRLVRQRELSSSSAAAALQDLADLDLERHGHVAHLARIWDLRDNLTAYDAVYVALAEALDATLLTCDRAMGSAAHHRARVHTLSDEPPDP